MQPLAKFAAHKIVLRPMVLDDAATFASWATDATFCDHADWTTQSSSHFLVPWWRAQITSPPPDLLRLAAVLGDDIVGYVDLHGDTASTRELGFVIGPSTRWGQRLGTAAALAGLAYGFEQVGLSSIWAEALHANAASVRILQRLGMTYTGEGEAAVFAGSPSTYAQYALTRMDWLRHDRR
ncbi:GNAT family N-acetyltransferase [Microbacterium mitrae]|uniref:GNAT family N-acetyltransferase n=1 Tax=Microbacterium mitrae TaxID=664640 RepID=A0A5C8HPA3_9MICO|nr:GNAT family N-acetyltransferase [Microbacterium mitrae]TXK05970.1 GNAT family N-acetyltransferase [Microbacterium mitrae]